MLTILCSIKWVFFCSFLLTLSSSQGFYMMLIWNVPSWVANILPNSWFWSKSNCQSLLLALDCELKRVGGYTESMHTHIPLITLLIFWGFFCFVFFPGCFLPGSFMPFSPSPMAKTRNQYSLATYRLILKGASRRCYTQKVILLDLNRTRILDSILVHYSCSSHECFWNQKFKLFCIKPFKAIKLY